MNKLIRRTLLILVAISMVACVDNDPVSIGQSGGDSDPETDTFRAGLINQDDISMDFGDDSNTRQQALAGQTSVVALLTADAVISTNLFLGNHLLAMRLITALPPTAATPNSRLWQGDDDGVTYRVFVEKSQTPRGVRFDYLIAGKPSDAGEDAFLALVDGHVTRIDTRPAELGRQGFGIIRYNFDNINTLDPTEEIAGVARIAFRKVGNVKQVHTRMVGVETPNDPDMPEAAEYMYTLLPNKSGAMRFYGIGDVNKDGAPYENVAVHSAWREDHSGIGAVMAFGGSLDVDYWLLGECWESNLLKGYEKLEVPGMTHETGDAATCFNLPDDLEIPEHSNTVVDEDPAIPGAHPDEE